MQADSKLALCFKVDDDQKPVNAATAVNARVATEAANTSPTANDTTGVVNGNGFSFQFNFG
jgi:hypothetical protein